MNTGSLFWRDSYVPRESKGSRKDEEAFIFFSALLCHFWQKVFQPQQRPRPMTRVATPKLILTIFDDHHPSCITSLTNPFLQEQLKFIYDTLEEFVLCGYTFFPVKDISQNLKLKSTRKPGCKTNQYEKEYSVIFKMSFSKCTSALLFTRTLYKRMQY